MKIKPLYMYGIIFVIIIAAIVLSSNSNNQEMSKVTNPNGETAIPNDSVHQGLNGPDQGSPSKSNVREDFWTKLDSNKKAYESNPDDTLAMKNYALMLGMSHQTEKALELYEKILAKDPNRVDILLAQGLAYFNNQNYEMAEVVTKKIIALNGNNLEAKYNLGVIEASKGDLDGARKIWKEIAETFPGHPIGKLAMSSLAKVNQ